LVHGRSRTRTPIGRVGILSLKDAREKARDILAEKQLGRYQSSTVTFTEALELYFKNHLDKNVRPKTSKETKRLLDKHFRPRLQHEKLVDITKASVAPIVGKLLDTPSTALHAHTAVTGFFRWSRAQFLEHNPLDGMKPPYRPVSRDRVLSAHELRRVFSCAMDEGSFNALVALLTLSGQRVNQIANLRGEFIDYEHKTITWPGALMKGKREHTIPYGDLTASILEGRPKKGLLFPARGQPDKPLNGFSKLKQEFGETCGVSDWTLHDLRRTFSTNLAALQIPQHVTEKLLDHRTGTISGVAAIYNRYTFMDEMRAAIAKWEDRLSEVLRKARADQVQAEPCEALTVSR
jgi:integrase